MKKNIWILLLILLWGLHGSIEVYADFNTKAQENEISELLKQNDKSILEKHDFISEIDQIEGLNTEEYPEDSFAELIDRLNIRRITARPKEALMIECFDVNDKEMIVMGSSDSTKKTIQVYNIEGQFLYGFKFESDGSIGVEWIENDYIAIYYVRSDFVVIINSDGEIINILDILNDGANSKRIQEVSSAGKRMIDGKIYVPRNRAGFLNWFLSSYGELIVIDEQGQEHTIYDRSSFQTGRAIGMFVFIGIFITIVVVGVTKEFVKLNKNNISQ